MRFLLLLLCLLVCSPLQALEPVDGALFVRVVDVGQGLCCLVRFPDGSVMVYDAGDRRRKSKTAVMKALHELLPVHSRIELFVISHSDADHIGAVKPIVDQYGIERSLRPTIEHDTKAWELAQRSFDEEVKRGRLRDIKIGTQEFWPGSTIKIGGVFVTMLSGFGEPPAGWGRMDRSDRFNAGSIVIRLQYADRAVLLTGDAVGRHHHEPDDDLFATEKFLLDMSSIMRIDADVLVAPHHGGDNGSSLPFIEKVAPKYVIFPAGNSSNDHPRNSTAERIIRAGVQPENIFRTDRGDDEGEKEWDNERVEGTKD